MKPMHQYLTELLLKIHKTWPAKYSWYIEVGGGRLSTIEDPHNLGPHKLRIFKGV